jgi:MFS family permease
LKRTSRIVQIFHHGESVTVYLSGLSLANACPDSTRIFSIAMGLMSIGSASGPTLGSILIHISDQVLSVFYFAIVLYLFCAIFAWTVLPESLPQQQMLMNRSRHAQRREGSHSGSVFRFLVPLGMFLPAKLESIPGTSSQQRDWNLTLIASAYASTVMVLVNHIRIILQDETDNSVFVGNVQSRLSVQFLCIWLDSRDCELYASTPGFGLLYLSYRSATGLV